MNRPTERSPAKPRILVITSSFPRGINDGTCGYIREFARRLSSYYELTVVAPPDTNIVDCENEPFDLVRSRSVLPLKWNPILAGEDLSNAHSKPFFKLLAIIPLLSFAWCSARLALRSDIICSHWMIPNGLIGALLSFVLRKPHLLIEHSGALHLLRRTPAGRLLARFIVCGSNKVVTVSNDLRRKLETVTGRCATRISVVPMGIVCSDFVSERVEAVSSATSSTQLLCFGRLTRIKGVEVLLRAASQLSDVSVSVAGDGPARPELEHLALQLGINARFYGMISPHQRRDLFEAADIVVIPSIQLPDGRTEGLPTVCLEAMAAGKVVIGSRVGGLAEVIVDGFNGLLFEPGSPGDLASKVSQLRSSPELVELLKARAASTALRHDWSNVGPRFANLIDEIFGSGYRGRDTGYSGETGRLLSQ